MDKRLILILPILSGVFWGCGGVFVRTLNSFGFNSATILSARVLGAILILFILLLLFDPDSLKIKLKDIWLFIGSGIIGILGLNLCYNEAAFSIPLSFAALLLGLAPIFTLILSAIFFKEKITRNKITCLIIALFGCLLVSGLLETTGFTWSSRGIIFGLFSAVFWACYGIFSKFASERGYSTFTIIFYNFIVLLLVLAPFTDWMVFKTFLVSNPQINIPISIAHSVFVCVLPYYLFSYALTKIENGRATILCSGAEPVSATIFGAIFFAEYPSILNIIGIIITITALSLLIKLTINGEDGDAKDLKLIIKDLIKR